MDPLVVNFSFGIVLTSASAGLWLLSREHGVSMKNFKAIESRLDEVEKIFSEIKVLERELRKKQTRQAPMHTLDEKISKAEKHLKEIKIRAA